MQQRRISSRSAVILLLLGLALATFWALAAAPTTTPATIEWADLHASGSPYC
jgi:hypothetical protein